MGREWTSRCMKLKTPKTGKPKEVYTETLIIKLSKVKHKKQILKAAREKELIAYKECPKDYEQIFQHKPSRSQESRMIYSRYTNNKSNSKLPTKNTIPGKTVI